MQLTREELLMKLGAARDQSRIAWIQACCFGEHRSKRHIARTDLAVSQIDARIALLTLAHSTRAEKMLSNP